MTEQEKAVLIRLMNMMPGSAETRLGLLRAHFPKIRCLETRGVIYLDISTKGEQENEDTNENKDVEVV